MMTSPTSGVNGGDDELPGIPSLPGLAGDERSGTDEPIAAILDDGDDGAGLDDDVGGLDGLEPSALTPIDDRVETRDDGTEGFDEPAREDDLEFGSEGQSYADDGVADDENALDDLELGDLGEEDGGELGFDDGVEEGEDEAPMGLPPLDRNQDEGDGPIEEPPPRITDRGDD